MSDAGNNIAELKKEIERCEANYAAMDSAEARNDDIKAAYGRYMRQAEGLHPAWLRIAAGLFIAFAALLGYIILENISGESDSAAIFPLAVVCVLCAVGMVIIAVCDIVKRSAEAKMRLSSHIHRYDMQVKLCRVQIEELKIKLAEIEKP